MKRLFFIVKSFWRRFLDILLPPQCPVCRQLVEEPYALCPDCFKRMRFIVPPVCRVCGRPFVYLPVGGEKGNDGFLCPSCLEKRYFFKAARAGVVYDYASKKIILPFKHSDRTDLSHFMTGVMCRSGKEFFPKVQAVLPVPIHKLRLLKRKYNQAALLAKEIAEKEKLPYLPDALQKAVSTQSQGHLNRRKRQKNVRNSFVVKKKELVKGKSLLLIDDVFTTGATVNECSRVLKKAGAKEVYVLTFAKVC